MTWQDRESRRFPEGYYKPVPWAQEGWFMSALAQSEELRNHFVHMSRKEDGDLSVKVSYTPSPELGERDRQVTIRPGRYLIKYFSHVLSHDEINKWSGDARAGESIIKFAFDPINVEDIYRRCGGNSGVGACMSYGRDQYRFAALRAMHPTHVYCAGDIQLSYIDHPTTGKIIARALVWPEKKLYTRVYGDERMFVPAIEALGYRSGLFDGARLTTIYAKNYPPDKSIESYWLIGPYVDHIKWARLTKEGLFLSHKATGATHSCQHGDGVIYPLGEAPLRPGFGDSPLADWRILIAREEADKNRAEDKPDKSKQDSQSPAVRAPAAGAGTEEEMRSYYSVIERTAPQISDMLLRVTHSQASHWFNETLDQIFEETPR